MKTAAARGGRGGERSAYKIAEKLAKNAGVHPDAWVEEAIAEYAEDLGVAPDELTERERLEAIEERIDRLARPAAEPRRAPEPARLPEREPDHERITTRDEPRFERAPRPARDDYETRRAERSRLDEALEKIEQRAARAEQRASRALESAADARERSRLEETIAEIETRAERNQDRTARALEALTGLVETRGVERGRLEQAVEKIESRAARNEQRTAEALQSLHSLVETHGGERERLQQAIAEVEARAERNAERTAQALEKLGGLVEARQSERDRLEAAIERVGKRAEENEARTARALESLTALAQPAPQPPPRAPREDAVASRLEDLARRATRTEPSADGDDETFRLVAERLARRRKARGEAEPAAKPEPRREEPNFALMVADMQRELRRLADKVENLSGAAVGTSALDALRAQTREIETAISAASDKAATVEQMERQVGQLAAQIEKLVGASPAPAEMTQALKALAEARAEIDRNAPAAAFQALERRMEELGARVEAAARRPAVDLRPLEDVARRVEAIRLVLDRQAAARPDAAALNGALQALNEKLDRAFATGSQSAATMMALQGMVGRLEEALQRPAPLDARPIEDLARRIEGVRGAVERQGGLAPKVDELRAAVGEIRQKVERPSAEIARLEASLGQIAAQVEAALRQSHAVDLKPIEDLARRIESVRKAVEGQSAASAKVERLEQGFGEILARLDHAARGPQLDALDGALRQLAAKVEAAVSRPQAPAFDPAPFDELSRRIDAVKGGFAPHAARLESALGDIRARLDRPAAVALDTAPIEDLARRIDAVKGGFAPHAARLESALGDIRARLDKPAAVALDTAPIEDLARRIDALKGGFAPHAARLESALGDIRARLEKAPQSAELDAALRSLSAKFDEAASRPATVALDPKPIEDLARRIESVRASLEKPQTLSPQVERLESALGAVAEKLDRAAPIIDANGINSTLAAMNARLEEAFRRPAQVEIDREPIDALTARLDEMRETVARQAEQFDPGRLEKVVRGAVERLERPTLAGADAASLTAAIEKLAARVERGPASLDFEHIEDLLNQTLARLERPGVEPADFAALTHAVSDLAANSAPALDGKRLEALLEHIVSRLERPGIEPADFTALTDAVTRLAAKSGAPALDSPRVEALLHDIAARLDRSGAGSEDIAAVIEAVAALGAKLDRASGAFNVSLLEDLTRDVSIRLDAVESKIEDRNRDASGAEHWAHLELAVRELAEKLGEVRAAADTRAIEQHLTLLHDRLDDVAEARAMPDAFVEQAAQALARDVGARIAAATPDALIGHLADIHERLDLIGSARAAPAALEDAMRELAEELEALRASRELVDRGVATLSDMRAEQSQIDRRMDARFSGVQDVLEKVVDRLARIERDMISDGPRPPVPPPARPAAPAAPNRAAMLDIPERDARPAAALAEPDPLAVDIAAQGRAREPDSGAAKSAAINAHIAAARRAANQAAVESERREQIDEARKAAKGANGLAQRAQSLLKQHQRPVLLSAAGALTLLTGVAVLEWRGHNGPVRKSELEAPAAPSTPLASLPAPRDAMSAALDNTPTGAIGGEPKVIAAPLAAPAAPPKAATGPKPAATLVSTLPAGLNIALAQAGASGDVGAEIEIAQRFLEARTVPRDPKVAADWLQVAADSGSPFAQYRLGALYEKGVGVAKDTARARELYTRSAEAGNSRAMHNLAVLYAQDGGSGKPDYAAALTWFRKAAEYGVRDSQFNLGVLYGRGLGAAQDVAQSWLYFSLAAKQGDADATHKRDEVANRMDGRAMTAAKKMLDEFKTKTPDPAVNDPPPVPAAAASDTPPASDKPKAATSVKG